MPGSLTQGPAIAKVCASVSHREETTPYHVPLLPTKPPASQEERGGPSGVPCCPSEGFAAPSWAELPLPLQLHYPEKPMPTHESSTHSPGADCMRKVPILQMSNLRAQEVKYFILDGTRSRDKI